MQTKQHEKSFLCKRLHQVNYKRKHAGPPQSLFPYLSLCFAISPLDHPCSRTNCRNLQIGELLCFLFLFSTLISLIPCFAWAIVRGIFFPVLYKMKGLLATPFEKHIVRIQGLVSQHLLSVIAGGCQSYDNCTIKHKSSAACGLVSSFSLIRIYKKHHTPTNGL